MTPRDKIRNVAIVAHIDHGKTTLLDGLLKQSHLFRANQHMPERAMDSYDQERERGITIFAKPTSLFYGDYKINLIDTPGHADFSCEVERVLGMVNSVLLLVDAKEGPMPQTRFVLSKALQSGLIPLVVLNKVDRPQADPDRVLNELFDLFVELGANDEQLAFDYCYASGLGGYAKIKLEDSDEQGLAPLLELIIQKVAPPKGDPEAPFLLQVASISFDTYLGRQASGRILQGNISKGVSFKRLTPKGLVSTHQVAQLEGYLGLQKVPLVEAGVGEIVCLSGLLEVEIGDTLAAPEITVALPPLAMEEPTVSVELTVNNGPFVGRSGRQVTMNKIRERLLDEQRRNVSYLIEEKDEMTMRIAGRGELHLAILLEAMRREGFEFCVAKPQVILKEVRGVVCEPFAKVHVEVPEQYSGTIIQQLSMRGGLMRHLETSEELLARIEFIIPVRGLVGYRNPFLTSTRGLGVLTSIFEEYGPWQGELRGRHRGVLVSTCQGKANAYALFSLEERGTLFVEQGDEVYEGMIVGEQNREGDLQVNPTRAKQLTNVRASGSDEKLLLAPPRRFILEEAIGFIDDDELVEVTPDAIRMRKKWLTAMDRQRAAQKKRS